MENKDMKNKELYISFRKSLDSYRDVVIAEIELIEGDEEKEKFAVAVIDKIKDLLGDIAKARGPWWKKQNAAQAEKFKTHAEALLSANAPTECPPGFESVNGICVRI